MAGVLRNMLCCVDCRVDEQLENNFLILNLLGKPVFLYVLEELFKIENCLEIKILTNSEEIKKQYSRFVNSRGVEYITSIPEKMPLFLYREEQHF